MYRPNILIPVYNHGEGIRAVVAELQAYQLPCVIVDDGSDESCRQVLDALDKEHPWIKLVRLPRNFGKGYAVCQGLVRSSQLGFSHSLQVDADGQHDLRDIPAFIRLSEQHPEAVISGDRQYDKSAPASRRHGRRFCDLWVWINTLSLQIRDSMCGFRLYPLDKTLALIQETPIGHRMDFDTDILVRLFWRGVPVLHVPTQVRYSEDNCSHFDIVRDNLRISWLHTRLFFGMLLRSPLLLKRKLIVRKTVNTQSGS